jgi:hypothetical protein
LIEWLIDWLIDWVLALLCFALLASSIDSLLYN